jgi:CBS domain containing-hemolysin-like protein
VIDSALPVLGPTTLLALAALLCAAAFFSATETALTSLQKVDRTWIARQGSTGRQVVNLLGQRPAVIATVLIGNETANVGLASAGAALLAATAPDKPWLNVLVLSPLLVMFADMTPKILGLRFNRLWAQISIWPFTAFFLLVSPVRIALTWLVSRLARTSAVALRHADALAEDELLVYVDRSAETGAIDPLEREIIEAVFEFDHLTVERLMTPRPDMVALSLGQPWSEMLERVASAPFSRLPALSARGDDVVGVLLVRDLLRLRRRPPDGPIQLRSLLLPPVFVPASKSAESMLREFLDRKFHMAFVVDEHGTLVGLVTLDDLLSELIQELDGEPDAEGIAIAQGALLVQGAIDLDDFREETGIETPPGDYHTLAGLVFHHLGRLPRRGDAVDLGRHRFTVRSMEGRRVTEVAVTPLTAVGEPS